MELWELLDIQKGVTAVIGGGGKTTLLRTLGESLCARGRVLLCTTTKIYPFPGIPLARSALALAALADRSLVCAGTVLPETGKLMAPPVPLSQLTSSFDYILAEADGAAGHPLKAHAPHEPVIPPEARQVVTVVGASGFGRTVMEAAHRPERYAALCGAALADAVTPAMAAAVLRAEGLPGIVYINQVEDEASLADARALASALGRPVAAGSLHRGVWQRLEP